MPEGKWELFKGKSGKYRFRLRAANGQCIAQASQSYHQREGAMEGMQSVKNNVNAPLIDLTVKKVKPK
ncbi:MAG: YegP family protein [Promethearchaeati archaeon SRVP18_Atabeyarchaeia-1]